MTTTVKRKKFTKVPVEIPISDLSPLNINCGSTKCEDGLHCFRMTKKQIEKAGSAGVCKTCGVNLINWDRVQKQNPRDAEFIFKELKNELIRHVFWHMPIDIKDIERALKRGTSAIDARIVHRLTNIIGIPKPFRNGFTPYKGDIIYYAQHATATCCRRCMEYWYDIPMGRQLTNEEISFSKELITLYLKERLPQLYTTQLYGNIK